jgi:hypothetical protein
VKHAQHLYKKMYSLAGTLCATSDPLDLRGNTLPVYVDEYWEIEPRVRDQLHLARIICRLGTPFDNSD